MSPIARPHNTNMKMLPLYSILQTTGVKVAFLSQEKSSKERTTTERKVT